MGPQFAVPVPPNTNYLIVEITPTSSPSPCLPSQTWTCLTELSCQFNPGNVLLNPCHGPDYPEAYQKFCGLWNSSPDLRQESVPNGSTLILVNFSHKETACYEIVSTGRSNNEAIKCLPTSKYIFILLPHPTWYLFPRATEKRAPGTCLKS